MRCWIFRPRANPHGRARGRGGQRTAGRDAAGGARRAHQGTAAQLSVSVFMQDKC